MIDLVLGWINSSYFLGIKMDIYAHSIIGLLIYFFCKMFKINNYKSILIVFFFALSKELRDHFFAENTYLESIKDLFFSIWIPFMISEFKNIKLRFFKIIS